MKQKKRRPFLIRQRDISDCGAACLVSVCAYYGLHVAVSRVRQMAGTDKHGTSVLGIVEAAIQLGLNAKGIRADYESITVSTMPVIIHVILDERISHYVVLMKASSKNVIIMDPAQGSIKKLKPEEFNKIWTGIAVLLMPGDDFCPNEKSSNTGRIIKLATAHRRALVIAFFCAALVSLLGLSVSLYVKEIVDHILVSKNISALNVISLVMLVVLIMQFIVTIMKNRIMLKTGKEINSSLVMGYFRHVMHLPKSFFDSMRVGEMISRINDAVKITTVINDVTVNWVVDVLIIIFSLSMMLLYNSRLALLMLLIVPVYCIFYLLENKINKIWQRRIMAGGAELDSQLVESFGAATSIRQLGLETHFCEKLNDRLDKVLQSIYGSALRQVYIQSSADMMTRVFTVILLWTGTYFVIGEKLTMGELLSFYTLFGFFNVPVLYLLNANRNITEALIAADRLFEIMDLQRPEDGWKKLVIDEKNEHVIEFKNVAFQYGNNEPVLKNVNLHVKQKTITGIKGKSGSGKSTIAALLLRLYDPCGGSVTINNIDLKELDRKSLTSLITVAPQQCDLFYATISENITLGKTLDPQWLEVIAEKLGINEFAERFPKGMNTMITEQGNNLSGGQKQRISLARALYRNTPVLIIDEATAAIDSGSEQKIMQTIEWYKNCGNTVIIIAHNDATLEICDNIAVLKDGVLT